MANRFSLAADITPTVDQGAAEREGQQLAETFESELGDLGVGANAGGIGGLGGARGGGGGGGMGGATAAGGALGRGAMGTGAAASGLAKVTLAGAVGFGLLKGIQTLAGASPALKQTNSMFGDAMDLFFRPFGNALSKTLRPFAEASLDMATNFNDAYSSDGLGIALVTLGSDAITGFATGMKNALTDIATGEGTLADFLFAGTGAIALTKLVTDVSLTSLISKKVGASTLINLGSKVAGSSLVNTASTVSAKSLVSTGASALLSPTALIAAGGIAALAVDQAIVSEFKADNYERPDARDDSRTTSPNDPGETFTGPNGTEIPVGSGILPNTTIDPPTTQNDAPTTTRGRIRAQLADRGVSDSTIDSNIGSLTQAAKNSPASAQEIAREFANEVQKQSRDDEMVSELRKIRRQVGIGVGVTPTATTDSPVLDAFK